MDIFFAIFFLELICRSLSEQSSINNNNDPQLRTAGLLDWLNQNKNMVKDKLSYGAETMNKALGIGNDSVQLASSFGSNLIDEGTQYAKQGVQIASKFGLRGINDSAGIAYQVIDLMERVPLLKHVTSYGRAGVEFTGNFSQNAFNALNKFKIRKLDFVNDLAQRGGSILSNVASIGTSIGQALTAGGTNLLKGGVDGGLVVMEHAYDKLQGLNRMGHRFIDTLRSVVYGSTENTNAADGNTKDPSITIDKTVQGGSDNLNTADSSDRSASVMPIPPNSNLDSSETMDGIERSSPNRGPAVARSIIQIPPRTPRHEVWKYD